MNPVTQLLRRAFPALERFGRNVHTLAVGQGQWRSIREGVPVDREGAPLPWYTYPAIEYLRQFDLSKSAVFEFGGGNSSRFWAARAALVVTVESDPVWFQRLQSRRLPAQRLLLRQQQEDYVAALAEQPERFDLIVIDGAWRQACARAAVERLPGHGLILLDNADKFPAVADFLRGLGLFEIDFNGFGPVNNYAWTTALFVRADAGLQRNFRRLRPIGGLDARLAADGDKDSTMSGDAASGAQRR
jgi:hypothetical protein